MAAPSAEEVLDRSAKGRRTIRDRHWFGCPRPGNLGPPTGTFFRPRVSNAAHTLRYNNPRGTANGGHRAATLCASGISPR